MIEKFEDFKNYNMMNPFDMNSKYNYVEFSNPLYSMLYKERSAKIINISPNEYFKIIGKNFNISFYDSINSNAISEKLVDKYAENMKNGDKFPLCYYYKENSKQEGRHRVLACKKLGIKNIPVIEFFTLTFNESKQIALKLKNKTDDEIINFLKLKGFNRFTKIDKREIINVFKYKF